MIKKIILLIIFQALVIASAFSQPAMHRILVDVQLGPEYLIVTQVRDMNAGGYDEDKITVSGKHTTKKFIMNVSIDGEESFTRLDFWNPLTMTERKQGKCGRMWTDANEALLCWGLVPNERKTYYVTYPLRNVLYADGEYDVLDFNFFQLEKPFLAEKAVVRLHLKEGEITAKNIDMGKSHADGDISLSEGGIVISSKAGDNSIAHMPVHIVFREGLFGQLPSKNQVVDIQEDDVEDAFVPEGKKPIQRQYSFSDSELHSPMMQENKPKNESKKWAIFELIEEYPKTSILLGCLLLIIVCYIYRKVKAMKLDKKTPLTLLCLLCAMSVSAQLKSMKSLMYSNLTFPVSVKDRSQLK